MLPAWPNYVREGTARGAPREKTFALDGSLRMRRLPVFEHPHGQAHLWWHFPCPAGGCGAGEPEQCGMGGQCMGPATSMQGLHPATEGTGFVCLGLATVL